MAIFANLIVNDVGHITLPSGNTAQRPATSTTGMIRTNTTLGRLESYNGSSWVKSNDNTGIYVYLWGAGGGGGTPGGWSFGARGGGGGFAYGQLVDIAPGTSLILVVGGGGAVNSTTNAFGGGGRASTNGSDNRYGSGGGGYTGLFLGSVTQANSILIAGGGGGGGSSRAGTGNQGGAGGGTRGQDGVSPYDSKPLYRGRSGTQYSAGANASSDAVNTVGGQTALLGGAPIINAYGGAGGGGYWGGSAGGYSEPNTMGGGGGGSGFINPLYIIGGVNLQGDLATVGGSSSSQYTGTIGVGGQVAAAGNNGYAVVIKNGITTAYTYTGSNITIII
jgi:hypothetical protein